MITTKELLEWRNKVINTKEQAEKKFEEYKEKLGDGIMAGYYEYLTHISSAQLAIIERLISRSEEDDKVKNECKFLRYLPEDVQDMSAGYYCTKNPKLWDLIVPDKCKGCARGLTCQK